MRRSDPLSLGSEQVRVRRWRDDATSALVAPRYDGAHVQQSKLEELLQQLTRRGVRTVYTAALAPRDQQVFRLAGFEVFEHLHLLRHDLAEVPSTQSARLRRGRRGDLDGLLALDNLAFEGFWRLDGSGFDDAMTATPSSRFRVATGRSRSDNISLLGYSIVGRAADRGYLQRLAVHPAAQGRGLGRALVIDGLAWLKRRHSREVMVNTQETNTRALGLYRAVGFHDVGHGLDVLAFRCPGVS